MNQTQLSVRVVGKSAFTEARKKLKSSVFTALNQHLIEHIEASGTLKTWKGFRLYAIDGSKIRLPDVPDIHDYFGSMGNGDPEQSCPMGLASACYDVCNDLFIDTNLSPANGAERVQAMAHLNSMAANALALYDRGYPAFWFMQAHVARGIDFCMRTPWNLFNETRDFYLSGAQEQIVTLTPERSAIQACQAHGMGLAPIDVRLVRVALPDDEIEILITSVLDTNTIQADEFKALYHERWGIEEAFKRIKSRLEVENFSGKSVLAIKQDFYAKMVTYNIAALLAQAADPLVKAACRHCKYEYAVNQTQALSRVKGAWVLLYHLTAATLLECLDQLITTIALCREPIRPDRQFERKWVGKKKARFPMTYKRVL